MGHETIISGHDAPMTPAKAKRCARDAIQRALRTSDGRGVKIGPFLLGLWQVSVGTLLEAGDPEDVCAVLLDRIGKVRGYGRNADAPALSYDDNSLRRRAAEAAFAAEIIVEAIDEYTDVIEDEDADDPMPEAILDAALVVLTEAWGPVHLRRAMREQVEAVAAGRDKPIMPAEPSIANNLGRDKPLDIPHATEEAEPIEADPRSVEIVMETAVAREDTVWVAAMTIRNASGSRLEVREIIGQRPGRDAKEAQLEACLEVFRALGSPRPGDRTRFSTNSSFLVAEMSAGAAPRQDMGAAEAANWHELEESALAWLTQWITRQPGTDGPLDQRCDKILRHKLVDLARNSN